jgi:hypothetical protein
MVIQLAGTMSRHIREPFVTTPKLYKLLSGPLGSASSCTYMRGQCQAHWPKISSTCDIVLVDNIVCTVIALGVIETLKYLLDTDEEPSGMTIKWDDNQCLSAVCVESGKC